MPEEMRRFDVVGDWLPSQIMLQLRKGLTVICQDIESGVVSIEGGRWDGKMTDETKGQLKSLLAKIHPGIEIISE